MTPRLLEITPPRREGGPPASLAIGVMLSPQLLILAVLVLLAVYLPIARIFLGVWVLWYAFIFDRPHRASGGQTPYERLRQKTGARV